MRPASIFLASLFLVSSGCSLYENNKPPPPCIYGSAGTGSAGQAESLRNPQTGQCQSFSEGNPCDSTCGACPESGASTAPSQLIPSWGFCTSQCTGLDENTCEATPGCRAAYIDPCSNGACPTGTARQTPVYYGCWATDQVGPIEGGGCEGLDAESCSRHDDCVAVHASGCTDGADPADPTTCGVGDFEYCSAEPTPAGACTSDADCGAGYHCDTSACPKCNSQVCDSCTGTCQPDQDPGSCTGTITCSIAEPVCPAGSVPGIANGCYTGYCIPDSDCLPPPPPPPPPPACDTITDETTCISRTDCTPIYEGQNCSCDASGACSCEDWVFSSCEAAGGSGGGVPVIDGGSAGGVPVIDGGSAGGGTGTVDGGVLLGAPPPP